jgi:hypothetical protein
MHQHDHFWNNRMSAAPRNWLPGESVPRKLHKLPLPWSQVTERHISPKRATLYAYDQLLVHLGCEKYTLRAALEENPTVRQTTILTLRAGEFPLSTQRIHVGSTRYGAFSPRLLLRSKSETFCLDAGPGRTHVLVPVFRNQASLRYRQ